MDEQTLIRGHRLAQIRNGAAASGLVRRLLEDLRVGRVSRDQFIAQVVAANLLSFNAATRLAEAYLMASRALVGVGGEIVKPQFSAAASVAGAEQVLKCVDQAGVDKDFWRIVDPLIVAADKAAKDAGRVTVVESVEASGRYWRRVTDANPCAFCAMLVTRGPAYRSEARAGRVVGARGKPRGTRQIGSLFHDHCGCSVVEFYGEPGSWVPTKREEAFIDLYYSCDGDLRMMRAQGQGIVSDALVPEKQKKKSRLKTQTGGAGGGERPPKKPRAFSSPDDWRMPQQKGMAGPNSPSDNFGPVGAHGFEPPATRSEISLDEATVFKILDKHGADLNPLWGAEEVFQWVQGIIDRPSDAAPEGNNFVLYGMHAGSFGMVVVSQASRNSWYIATGYDCSPLEWESWKERRSY